MNNEKKSSAKQTLNRSDHFMLILLGEGLLVGIVGGIVVALYRYLLQYASLWLEMILDYTKGNPAKMVLWFLALVAMAYGVSLLLKWEPMIGGSGIPQLEGEMTGKLEQCWWKVLIAKFTGGFLCLLAGLSLGREGPSIQLGAMAGKGVSRVLDRDDTEEKFLLTCGASAGLAAAFHAPLAGVMFSLEEVHKNFSVSVLVSVMAASISADYLASYICGLDPVFSFDLLQPLPHSYYWMLLVLGVILGALGAFYNFFTLKMQSLFKEAKHLNVFTRVLIAFLFAGILGYIWPELLGSGHELVEMAGQGQLIFKAAILLLFGKFIFSGISFGSGSPGGIFFPLLVLGALIGCCYGEGCKVLFGIDAAYISNFVLLAMAGYFTAIVRAPMTGILLLFEMSGQVQQLLSLAIVSIIAYAVASLLKSKPIYESLLERLVGNGEEGKEDRRKILHEFVIVHGSAPAYKKISEVKWPEKCLLVAVQRGEKELIPKGNTRIYPSDTLLVMTDAGSESYVYDAMEKLCTHIVK